MKTVVVRLLLFVALATIAPFLAPVTASAQGNLLVVLSEDPFECDTIVRPLGTVSGFIVGEAVEFSSPQLNGLFSRRTADANGQVAMRWNCDAPQTWNVTVRGLSSGTSATFVVTGKLAPPPPQAPVGAAFDNKTAMTTAQMAIWKDASPFTTAGIYIPVNSSWDNRADKIQANLTASWVNSVFADGWSLIPIYVGFQAPGPCQTGRFEGHSLDPATARNQGLASAADAVESVTRLGIPVGSPIYYDMEAYRPGCAEAVLSFLDAWTEGVHAAGFISGVYGSRSSTMRDLSQAFGRSGFDAPDAVWISTGNGQPQFFGLESPSDGLWTNARMHQYRLNVTRTYGGVTLEIDENVVNAPLARPSGPIPTAPTTGILDSDGDGIAEPSPDNCDRVANPDQADLDNDGDGDACDRDIDGDGADNVVDIAPRDPTISSPTVPTAEPITDTDGDGIAEPSPDNCDRVPNTDQADLDNDGDGDVCDTDIDGDGVPNDSDPEPRDPAITTAPPPTAEPAAAPTPEVTAAPATAAPITDADGDGIAEPSPDNCDRIANPDQADLDGDGDGDPCDRDIDGDGIPNDSDPDPRSPSATAEAAPTAEPAETPVVTPTPDSSAPPTPTALPDVIVLPTPTPLPPVIPLPSVNAVAESVEIATPFPTAPPEASAEVAADTVSITVEDTSSLLPYVIATLAMFSAFCVGMGARSFRRNRLT